MGRPRLYTDEERKAGKRARAKAYREANKEKIAARHKAYREANKEKEAARTKAYREANKEKRAAHRKVYYEANKEKIAARHKAWNEANKEEKAAYNKAWNEANKEKQVARDKAYRKDNWLQNILKRARANAKAKGVPFDLDLPFLLSLYEQQNGLCHDTGTAMRPDLIGQKKRHCLIPSLDRRVPKKGYVKDNVVFVIWGVNHHKGTTPLEKFLPKLTKMIAVGGVYLGA